MKKKNIIIALILLIVFTITGCGSSNSNNKNYDNNFSFLEGNKPNKITKSIKMFITISALFDEKLAFYSGIYSKEDIIAGEYAFINFSENGSYYCEKDSTGNILDCENFDSFGYVKVHSIGNIETNGILISFSAFEKFGVKGAKEIYEILYKESNWNQVGYYKVGTDIEPDRYIVESIGKGYWVVMTGPVGDRKIINDGYLNGSDAIYLSNGQYIRLKNTAIGKYE